jgi:rhodanese-related sulfurtransferase
MIELTKTKRITVGVLLMFGVILLGMLTMATPKYYFKSDPSMTLKELNNADYQIAPGLLAREVLDKNKELVLIDIRSPYEFNKGNITGSLNIPAADILEDANFKQFKDFQNEGKKVYLYGKDIVEANIPFMTLQALGFNNLKILQGGFDYFKSKDFNTIAKENESLNDEAPVFDIQKYITEENIKSQRTKVNLIPGKNTQTSEKKSVQPEVKKSAPVKKQVEEEGC